MLRDMPSHLLMVLVAYLFSLVYGLNFVVTAVSFGLGGSAIILYVIILLPALIYALYFLRGNIELLYGKEHVLRILCYITSIISVFFTAVFIIPISY